MTSELFLAILSMDSYNRGYEQSISGLNFVPNITKISNATIQTDSLIQYSETGGSAGFYAISYNWNAQNIIMYRSSDSVFSSTCSTGGADVINGYGVGAGSPYGPQAQLAIKFFNELR